MTWHATHCIECFHDHEHCDTCGCHQPQPDQPREDDD